MTISVDVRWGDSRAGRQCHRECWELSQRHPDLLAWDSWHSRGRRVHGGYRWQKAVLRAVVAEYSGHWLQGDQGHVSFHMASTQIEQVERAREKRVHCEECVSQV